MHLVTDDTRITAIDTHAHFYPAFYLDALEAAGADPASTAVARGIGADSTSDDIKTRLDWADRAGVTTQVIAVTPQTPSVPGAKDAAHLAAVINDHYLEICATYPGRFLPYATLPLPHVDECLTEIERVHNADFVGFSVNTFLPRGKSIFAPQFDPVWEALNDRAAVVNIHPTGQGLCASSIDEFDLHWVNGAPIEDATAVLQLLKRGINTRFPAIRFHIAHLGGDLAFLAQRLEDNYQDWDAFPSSPMESLRNMYFDAANFHAPSLRAAVETYGADQILAGSDFPYFQEEKYLRAFDYVRDARLDPRTTSKILSGNASRLFQL